MLSSIKTLLEITDNYKNDLLCILIDNAKSFATSYCRLNEYSNKLDAAVIRMVIEDYNRLGSEGTDNQSFSGLSESYENDYSSQVYSMLNRYRKIKIL